MTNPIQSNAVIAFPLASQPVYTPICPTRPQVPIPELTAGPFISKWKIQVATGPVIAEARIGGIHVFGFLMIFGICSILVPIPCDTRPPIPFSL